MEATAALSFALLMLPFPALQPRVGPRPGAIDHSAAQPGRQVLQGRLQLWASGLGGPLGGVGWLLFDG